MLKWRGPDHMGGSKALLSRDYAHKRLGPVALSQSPQSSLLLNFLNNFQTRIVWVHNGRSWPVLCFFDQNHVGPSSTL